MADKRPTTSVFHRLESDKTRTFPHLQPLSIYSRTIFCDGAAANSEDPSWVPGSPFCKITVKIRNSGASVSCKRQLEDSCLDETYETPPKKPCLSTCRSPDLACVLDSSLSEVKNVTAELSGVAEKVNTVVSSSANKESPSELRVTPSLKCAGLFWSNSTDESDSLSSPSLSLSDIQSSVSPIAGSEDVGRRGPAFEFDMNDIMCLSPIDCNGEQLSSDRLDESCQTFHKEQQSREQSEAHVGPKDESSKQIRGIVEEKGVKENDEGYFTICYKTDKLNSSWYTPPPQIAHRGTSTPLDKFRQLVKRSSLIKGLGKAEPCSPTVNQAALNPSSPISLYPFSPISLYGSMNLDASSTSPKASLLDSKENREAESRDVVTLIQKSLVCLSVQPAPAATDTVSRVKESEDAPSVSQQVDTKFHVTFQEETFPTENLEITPPLQVQVWHQKSIFKDCTLEMWGVEYAYGS